jgi:hypothetical protein
MLEGSSGKAAKGTSSSAPKQASKAKRQRAESESQPKQRSKGEFRALNPGNIEPDHTSPVARTEDSSSATPGGPGQGRIQKSKTSKAKPGSKSLSPA